jgi:hypothetical protein
LATHAGVLTVAVVLLEILADGGQGFATADKSVHPEMFGGEQRGRGRRPHRNRSMQHAAVDDGAVHAIAEFAQHLSHPKAMIGAIVENRALSRTAGATAFRQSLPAFHFLVAPLGMLW